MGRRSWIVAGLVALGLVAGGLVVRRRAGESDAGLQTAVVTRGQLRQTVGGMGSLVPGRKAEVAFAGGGVVAEVLVAEGGVVAEGDPLAALDATELEADLGVARAGLESARASLTGARVALAALVAGPTERQTAISRLAVEQARNSLWGAQASRDGICGRVARKQGQPYECDSAESSVLRSEGAVRQAELELEALLAGATEAELASARERVASASTGVASAEAQVGAAERRLAQATITAPMAGTVTAVNVTVGAASGTGSAVQLADLASLQVEIRLDETDVAQVRAGQEAVISLDALPGIELAGEVREVGIVAESESGVVLYPVTVGLEATAVGLRPGMTADVEIVTVSVADALIVPLRAVVGGPDGATMVMRVGAVADGRVGGRPDGTGDRQVARPAARATAGLSGTGGRERWTARAGSSADPLPVAVQIGLTTDSHAQVLAGLAAGDVVVVQSAASSAAPGAGRDVRGGPMGGIGGVFLGR